MITLRINDVLEKPNRTKIDLKKLQSKSRVVFSTTAV